MRVSVILSTYNQPAWLELSLWGYAAQDTDGFELVIADDGSSDETAAVVERMRERTGMDIRHVWHADRGFRKCEILNRAIVAAAGDYLIFSDGDCIPRADFVGQHARLAAPDRFLSGGYLKLPRATSEAVTPEAIRSGDAFCLEWLRSRGWRPGRRALRLLRPGPAALLDRITPTRPSWNGHNASAAKDVLVKVNGYDMDMGYGGEDRALGERLEILGLRGHQIRHRVPCLHLHHDRPYVDPAIVARNREARDAIQRQRRTVATVGIAQLTDEA